MDNSEFRRARGFAAWLLLVAAAVLVVTAAWQFLGLPGSTDTSPLTPALPLSERGVEAVGSLASVDLTVLPVAAALLVALAGPPVPTARQATLTAVIIQGIALVLALIGWGAGLKAGGRWFPVTGAAELIIAGAGLILTVAVLRSRFLRKRG
jgi:hypothetical protein